MINATIIDGLYAYLDTCPLLSGRQFNYGELTGETGQAGVAYAVSADQTDEQVTAYQSGTVRCRSLFLLSSANDCAPDTVQELSDPGYFDRLAAWLGRENHKRHWPELPAGLTARNIRAVSAGYLYEPDANSGKYQIQLELEYYRKVVD